MKVALIMGVCGACRRDELVKMAVDDIEEKGRILIIRVPKQKPTLQEHLLWTMKNS